MSAAPQDDEARWAQAQSLLDRVPDESAEQRTRRVRRLRWLLVVALLVGTTALALVIAFVVIDRDALGTDEDVSTSRAVIGVVVGAVGVVIGAVGLVVQIRAMRRVRGWRSPLYVLTRRQRKQLLAQMLFQREAQRARAFLDGHPAPDLH